MKNALNLNHYFRAEYRKFHLATVVIMGLLILASLGISSGQQKLDASAASPTFFITGPTSFVVGVPDTINVKIDGTGEGSGLLGGEAHITYDSSKVQITDVVFGTCVFDSCVDLSEEGTVKLLGASGPSGMAVSTQTTFAQVVVNPISTGNFTFTFSKAVVIDSAQTVVSRTASNSSVSVTTDLGSICGNSIVEAGETCDDGNAITEACTYGQTSCTVCNASCQSVPGAVAYCGNSVVDVTSGEQCDDGNAIGGDGCSAICQNEDGAVCGDGILQAGEACDDGNIANGDGCSATCTVEAGPICGNAAVEAGEQCDDGNLLNGDGCSSACTTEAPAIIPTDMNFYVGGIGKGGINDLAGQAQVGDTVYLNTFVRYSDNSLVNKTSPSTNPGTSYQRLSGSGSIIGSYFYPSAPGSVTLRSTYNEGAVTVTKTLSFSVLAATTAVCGDGVIQGAEQCDDGNVITEACGYGITSCTVCNATCQSVAGSISYCGDSVLDAGNGEQCDDGNTANGDGCSATCTVEAPVEVPEEPLLPVAPEEAVEEATTVIEEGLIEEVVEAPIEAPETLTEVFTRLDECKANQDYKGARFDTPGFDTDGDGLSDGTECYAHTHPLKPDTDGDTCTDGDELNQLNQNPLDPSDCEIEKAEVLAKFVRITDPQPGWILATDTPRVTGILPLNSQSVTVVAFEADNPEASPVVAGKTTEFSEAIVAGKDMKHFEIKSVPLKDQVVYNLVATAKLEDGSNISSDAIQFSIDSSIQINKPEPQSIGETPLSSENITFKFIEVAAAQTEEGIAVEIGDLRPNVSGESDFGSQVFAVWNSLVLASSVISDSEEGTFLVQAPRNLETDLGHKVTLYAVKTRDGKTVRSDSVNVFFRIKGKAFPEATKTALWILLALLALGTLVYRGVKKFTGMKKFQKIQFTAKTTTPEEHQRKSLEKTPHPSMREQEKANEAWAEELEEKIIEDFEEEIKG